MCSALADKAVVSASCRRIKLAASCSRHDDWYWTHSRKRLLVERKPMKLPARITPAQSMTRRQFVHRTLLAAGVIAGAPAFLRGQNLNNKLNIAFIACGGRANTNLSELTIVPGRRTK